jgi:chemotaxis signal transduction protein
MLTRWVGKWNGGIVVLIDVRAIVGDVEVLNEVKE